LYFKGRRENKTTEVTCIYRSKKQLFALIFVFPLGSSQQNLAFPPPRYFCSVLFYCVFGGFVTKGIQKRDKKVADGLPQPPKK
jgi:hypothetical protein